MNANKSNISHISPNSHRAAADTTDTGLAFHNVKHNQNQSQPERKKVGGYRPGAGRKPGTTNKISGATILATIEQQAGRKFEELLAEGYITSINTDDKPTRLQYEKMFLNKVVADKTHLDLDITASATVEDIMARLVATRPEDDHDTPNQ